VADNWLKNILTDDTGVNFTPDKVGMVCAVAVALFAILAMVVIQTLAVFVKGQEFHPQDFGLGLAAAISAVGALLAGGGGAMWLASRQKPTPPEGAA
jgi:hypothetical protein